MPLFSKLTLVNNKKIVSVSKEIKQALKQQLKLYSNVIYNYPLFNNLENIDGLKTLSNIKYIVGLGRLTTIKQFDVLIKSYKNSKEKLEKKKINDQDFINMLNSFINDYKLLKNIFLLERKKILSGGNCNLST